MKAVVMFGCWEGRPAPGHPPTFSYSSDSYAEVDGSFESGTLS